MGLSFYRIELQHVLTLRMLVRLPEHSKQSFLMRRARGKGQPGLLSGRWSSCAPYSDFALLRQCSTERYVGEGRREE